VHSLSSRFSVFCLLREQHGLLASVYSPCTYSIRSLKARRAPSFLRTRQRPRASALAAPGLAVAGPGGAAWLLPGIFGHGPWKQDETYSFGMIHHMLVSGQYLVPTNAGQPFMEKPPLYYWTAVITAKLLHPLLPYHDGARLASVFYNLVTLVFVARIAKIMWQQHSL
jgi:hypothetical protein